LKTLYNFCSLANCTDGANPGFSLVQATDGNFYGSTTGTGTSSQNAITVFRLTKEGELTTLHTFHTQFQEPEALFQATNGILYGVTAEGGTSNNCGGLTCGTAFSLAAGLGQFVETVPTAGSVGESVTILGTDLADATHVFFNQTEAPLNVVSKTEIQTSVPVGATTGFVTVTRQAPSLKSNVKFQVLP
jgi:uncharacterized repeat protein (TIGR03803 family)